VSREDGSFVVPLPRGDVVDLRVSAEGYATHLLPDRCEGEELRILLAKGATVRVTVTDPGGSGVPGANVMVLRPRTAGSPYIEVRARAFEAGRLELPGLSPGMALVIAWADGWGTPRPVRLDIPEGGTLETEVQLPRGRTITGTVRDSESGAAIEGARVAEHNSGFHAVETNAGGRFELTGWAGLIGGRVFVSAAGYADASAEPPVDEEMDISLVPGKEITGQVVDPAGVPVVGAAVAAVDGGTGDTPQMRSGATGVNGRFRLTGIHPKLDRWHLMVRAAGYAMLTRQVTPGEDLGRIVLVSPRTISGVVLDRDRKPFPDAAVDLWSADTALWLSRQSITTDGAGTFRFGQLAPGEYVLSLVQPGAPPISKPVTVPADRDVTGVVLKPDSAGEITIRVVDQDDKPLAGMTVSLSGGSVRPRGTGPDGRATFRGLPAKEVEFDVYPSRFASKKYSYGRTAPTMPTGQEVTVRVKELSPIHGVVIGEDDKPIPHLVVAAVEPGGRLQASLAITDGEGRYTLWVREGATVDIIVSGIRQMYDERRLDRLPIGATVPGVTAPATGITVRPKTVRTDLTLAVRVLLPDGSPVAGASVLPRTRFSSVRRVTTDAQGWGRFEGLRAETYEIQVMTEGIALPPGSVNPEPIEVEPAGQDVVLRMVAGVVVEGVFRDGDGNPLAMAHVGIGAGDWFMSHARTDAEGRFRLAGLPGRKLFVTASGAKGWVRREDVTADGGLIEIRLGE